MGGPRGPPWGGFREDLDRSDGGLKNGFTEDLGGIPLGYPPGYPPQDYGGWGDIKLSVQGHSTMPSTVPALFSFLFSSYQRRRRTRDPPERYLGDTPGDALGDTLGDPQAGDPRGRDPRG